MDVGKEYSYLGMQLRFKKGRVEVGMSYYLSKVLQEFTDLQIE
jgi:hypothetical protein